MPRMSNAARPKLPRCPAEIDLTDDEMSRLKGLAFPQLPLEPSLRCGLQRDHEGQHAALAQSAWPIHAPEFAYDLWMQWGPAGRTLGEVELCPLERDPDDFACALPAGHPGAHWQEIEIGS